MKTVLVFSRFFPPMPDVGGRRFAELARYLPEFGWRVVVVTDPHRSEAQGTGNTPGLEVINEFYPNWWPHWRHGSSPGADASWMREAVLESVPGGTGMLSVPFRGKELGSLVERYAPDAVVGSYSPAASLALAAATARRARIPYVADMRDPWTLRPDFSMKPLITRRLEQRMERRLMTSASAVVFTSESARTAYENSMPGLPVTATIRNGVDLNVVRSVDRNRRPKLSQKTTLVHFGNVYGTRSLGDVMRALASLVGNDDGRRESLELVNFGNISAGDQTIAASLDIERLLRVEEHVPYEEGLEALSQSSLKLLISFADSDLFIPAKFYDYAATSGPTLCIAPERSELATLVNESHMGLVVSPGDREGIRRVLELAANGDLPRYEPDLADLDKFHVRQTASQYAKLLTDVAQGGRVPESL